MRTRIESGSCFEPTIGFSRAVRVGNTICVSGTAPIQDDGSTAYRGDVYKQTKRCIEIIGQALEEAGASLDDVVRTRVMLVNAGDWEDAARAHSECFGGVRPACTFAAVRGFIRIDWLVEVEADAIVVGPESE